MPNRTPISPMAVSAPGEVYSFPRYRFSMRLRSSHNSGHCSVSYAAQELAKTTELVYDNIPAGRDNEESIRMVPSQFATTNHISLLCGSFETLVTHIGEFNNPASTFNHINSGFRDSLPSVMIL